MNLEDEVREELQDIRALNLNAVAGLCGRLEKAKGWREGEGRSFGEIVALIHSEASEALEEHRNGYEDSFVYFEKSDRDEGFFLEFGNDIKWRPNEKPEGIPIELADILIRIFAFCEKKDIDIMKAVQMKLAYNLNRPTKHGGKQI